MSEQGKGSLLLPLGIGAAVLLLYLGAKKKEAAPPTSATEPATLLPEVKEGESSVPQIVPAPAPSYTQVSRMTDGGDGKDDSGDEDERNPEGNNESEDEQPGSSPSDQDDEDDNSSSPGSGNFVPSQRSIIPTQGRQVIPSPSPAYMPPANNTAVNNRNIVSKARFVAGRASKPVMNMSSAKRRAINIAMQKLRANMLPQPQQQVVAPPAANIPNTAFPSAQAPFVSITRSTAVQPSAAPVAQATIFPLKFGTTSPYVKEVQRKLGVSATGYFGTMTRTAIQKRFRVNEISEALYKQIITGKGIVPMARKPVTSTVRKAKKPVVRKYNKVKHR